MQETFSCSVTVGSYSLQVLAIQLEIASFYKHLGLAAGVIGAQHAD